MGLAFLNKKSWHTGSFQNIEKVWKAEEKAEELNRARKEALRRLKEERHYEEIRRMEIEAGFLPKSREQRLDWIYESGAIKNTSSEEYLLGKPFEELEAEEKNTEWRPTSFKESTANPANEQFTRVHEDPLFVIRQEELRRQRDIVNNPFKMRRLQKELESMRKGKKKKHVKKRRGSSSETADNDELAPGYIKNYKKSGRKDRADQKRDGKMEEYRNLTAEERERMLGEMQRAGRVISEKRREKVRRRDKEEDRRNPSFMRKAYEHGLEGRHSRR